MKLAPGPRPWSIYAVVVLLLGAGLWHLTIGLWEVYSWLSLQERVSPEVKAIADWDIVTHSARFTIVCIPVAAIALFASKVARWLVTVSGLFMASTIAYSALSLMGLMGIGRYLALNGQSLITPTAFGLATAFLWTPSARRWLNPIEEDGDATVFE